MPLINIEYDDALVSETDVRQLSQVVRDIVSKNTAIADVFVYSNTAQIKIQVAPIEIFVRLSTKICDQNKDLISGIRTDIAEWKQEHSFVHPINLTLIPMHWQIEIGI